MQAHATTLYPLFFEALLPTAEKRAVSRKTAARDTPRHPGEALLSMEKLCDRLTLLAQLELPCAILIAHPLLHLPDTLIKSAEMGGDSLSIVGRDFKICLRGSNIHSIRLSSHREGGSVDIFHAQGVLYASIRPVVDGRGAEVWRDVMDNPMLALV
ncbi:MAG: hypothetical protein ACKN9T_10930 [Candidatus Methylumidiphilus sp.]